MANFDETSGVVACSTPWGRWYQTMEEVFIEVNVPEGTKGKEVRADIRPKNVKLVVKGDNLIEGTLFGTIQADDSLWTLEDNKLLRICLTKTDKTAKNAWRSLLTSDYEVDPWTFDQMEQKLTLQRFQLENPGMDFSGAAISGGYHGGGPELP